MASSSTNTMIPQKKYEVFLSFRGEDTRNNFTSHLYGALCGKGIETFIDDNLVRGDEISKSLLNTIEGSTISVIIFSERYASSRWCLDELVKILECKNKCGQIVIPVFYHVVPADVRHQTGNFGNSFSKLEYKETVDKLQNWRIALTEAANLSGFDSQVFRSEHKLIEEVAHDILKKINDKFPINSEDQLIGVESRILKIVSLLNAGSKDVYILGIWGIGGIGKTTIATAVFKKISSYFEGSCFIENVREESKQSGGLARLLLSKLLKDENVKMDDYSYRRLSRKRVLIVFDNVTRLEQIGFLIENLHRLGVGSRIMIITRDKQVLENCGAKKVYEMKELAYVDALKLFNRYAFKKNRPDVGYEDLSKKVVQYAQGVPLALKVLGCHLFGKSTRVWGSAIDKLKIIPHNVIQEVLKISYDDLDDKEKNIFLDVACCFKGEDKDRVQKLMDASGFFGEIGISVLVDRALIIISDNVITMHDLLQKMGREIVRQESVNNPGKRSRVWHPKDVYQVLRDKTGSGRIQGISLDMSQVGEMSLNFRTFKRMRNLRFLRLYGENQFKICHFNVSGSILTKLRYFEWQGYPLKSLLSSIQVENLVSLILRDSKGEQLWDGVQNLINLKDIDLSGSNRLRRLPDLSLARNLEKLNLYYCLSLVETHPSIQYLNKLVELNLHHCSSLKRLPSSIHSESLQILNISFCLNLDRLPAIVSCNLTELDLIASGFKEFPSSVEFLSGIDSLDLESCSRLKSLPNSLSKQTSLEYLVLSGCSNLQRLPDELGNLEALTHLRVDGTSIRELPSSIVRLNNLSELYLKRCRGHELMGCLLPSWLSSGGMHSLTSLELIDCGITELPENLDKLHSIQELNLAQNNFESIPESIINLSRLTRLGLSYCERLRSLPKLPCSLTDLDAKHCTMLEGLSGLSILFTILMSSTNSWSFHLTNCFMLDRNELRNIVEDDLRKIMLNYRTFSPGGFGNICFPGSEIPEWFEYRRTGSSIEFELPSAVCSNKLVGFAYCVIVAFGDQRGKTYDIPFHVTCKWKFKKEDGDWHVKDNLPKVVSMIDYVESDHVIFGYEVFSWQLHYNCDSSYNKEGFIQFFVDHSSAEVEKCGIRLFYSKDFEASVKDRVRSFGIDEEEEMDLQPKRLKYTTKLF